MSTAAARWIACAALCVGLACGQDAPTLYAAHGTVKAVDHAARKITLDHEEIPGLMVAMTMEFEVAPGVVLTGAEPGTAVDFELIRTAGGYTITSLVRAGGP